MFKVALVLPSIRLIFAVDLWDAKDEGRGLGRDKAHGRQGTNRYILENLVTCATGSPKGQPSQMIWWKAAEVVVAWNFAFVVLYPFLFWMTAEILSAERVLVFSLHSACT